MTATKIDRSALEAFAPHEYSAFASDLGLRPGVWPLQLVVDNNFGNGLMLVASAADSDHRFVKYRQHLGCVELTIYND